MGTLCPRSRITLKSQLHRRTDTRAQGCALGLRHPGGPGPGRGPPASRPSWAGVCCLTSTSRPAGHSRHSPVSDRASPPVALESAGTCTGGSPAGPGGCSAAAVSRRAGGRCTCPWMAPGPWGPRGTCWSTSGSPGSVHPGRATWPWRHHSSTSRGLPPDPLTCCRGGGRGPGGPGQRCSGVSAPLARVPLSPSKPVSQPGSGSGRGTQGAPAPVHILHPQFTLGPPALTPPFQGWQQGGSACTASAPGDAGTREH